VEERTRKGEENGGREIERKTSVGGGWDEKGTKTAGGGRQPAEAWRRNRRGKGRVAESGVT